MCWLARPGTSGCSATRDRRNRPRQLATPWTLAMATLRSAALAAIPTRRSHSISSAGRNPHQSTNWSATCAARIAPAFADIPTSGAIWSRCGPRRSRRAIRLRHGGRGSANRDGVAYAEWAVTNPQPQSSQFQR